LAAGLIWSRYVFAAGVGRGVSCWFRLWRQFFVLSEVGSVGPVEVDADTAQRLPVRVLVKVGAGIPHTTAPRVGLPGITTGSGIESGFHGGTAAVDAGVVAAEHGGGAVQVGEHLGQLRWLSVEVDGEVDRCPGKPDKSRLCTCG
jgi:hypothetical protein